jgi:hypothetical protein
VDMVRLSLGLVTSVGSSEATAPRASSGSPPRASSGSPKRLQSRAQVPPGGHEVPLHAVPGSVQSLGPTPSDGLSDTGDTKQRVSVCTCVFTYVCP